MALTLTAFMGWMALSALWAPDAAAATGKLLELGLLWGAGFGILCALPPGEAQRGVDGFWTTLLWVGGVLAVLGTVGALAGGAGRLSVLGGGANTFGRNMGLVAVAAMAWWQSGRAGARVLAPGLAGLSVLLVTLSGSRGALLATALAGLVILLPAARTVRRAAGMVGALGGAVAAGFVVMRFTPLGDAITRSFQSRVVELTLEGRHASGREGIYHDALGMFAGTPLAGSGLNAFQVEHSFPYPHNLFLETAVEGGTVGVLLLLGVLASGLAPLLRLWRQEPALVAAFLLCLVSAQVSGDLFDSRGVFLVLALMAARGTVVRRVAT